MIVKTNFRTLQNVRKHLEIMEITISSSVCMLLVIICGGIRFPGTGTQLLKLIW